MRARERNVLVVLTFALSVGFALVGEARDRGPDKIIAAKRTETNVGAMTGVVGDGTTGPIATEIPKPKRRGGSPLRLDPAAGDVVPLTPGAGTATSSGKKAKSNPEVRLSFEGINHRDNRLADNGNQFSGEPPDQGLCVGNGYLLETVNSALRIYDAATGDPVTPVLSLNEFYGFPSTIDRSMDPVFTFGPFTFDISCHYDPDSNRWFHLALDLEQDAATGAFTGRNYLDLAVSMTGDPTGGWNLYRIPAMNDGSEGTPDHDCPGGPCLGDFPHIGVDKNGVYITTNEFPFFAAGFTGAQVYAISKDALVRGDPMIELFLFDTSQPQWRVRENEPGFTVWPALSTGKRFAGSQGGTEYFVSSNAVFDEEGESDEIIVWALSNTRSLDKTNPNPRLTRTIVPSVRYAVPANSVQKDGTIPLGNLVGVTTPGTIDTSDSRVLDVRYANGKLWAVLGTAAEVDGQQRAGVGWFILNASVNKRGVKASIRKQGVLAMAGESLAYPTVGVTASGRGVIGFTRVGEDLHPSVGYASIDDVAGVGPVHMIEEGNAPQDGFTEYPALGGNRPRWGDYGAAAVDGKIVYLAGQYIEQGPCSVGDLLATDCGGTRTLFANWSTRVSKLKP